MLILELYLMIFGVVVVILMAIALTCWVKAPPDVAFILSGWRATPRMLVGQGGVKVPLLERVDKLYLGQMTVDIRTQQSVPTNDFINVKVDAVAKVSVDDSAEARLLASKNFLNLTPELIADQLRDSLEGNMREIVGTLSLKEISTNRDSFSEQVKAAAAQDMERLGIKVISCNIQNITDETGLITDLGADNTARIRKDASIAKALADRDVSVKQAEAMKEANDAKVKAELEIAQRQNELAIRKAELKRESDIKQAEADAAYAIQEQEQRKAIETATVDAEIAKANREEALRKQQVAVREQELAAEVQKKADAEKYNISKQAEAELAKRQRESEAKLYEQQRDAEAQKAQAEAKKYAMEQEAAGITAKAQAEAEAIRLKGEAEAAAMDKKAEALKKYGKAAMAQMAIEILPKVAAEVAKPLGTIDKVTIFGGGNGNGMSSMSDNVPLVMAKTIQTIKEATGVDIAEIMRAESYDAKTTKNVNVTGMTEKEAREAVGAAAMAEAIPAK
ncbi:MAG: flotillin family protein [Selenomonas ruminantium]|jgi:flotillin|uniref:Flotillin family protein n=2 Tax=Selenomonas ruminantium TaxID=971 RepID=A0A927ZV90_SELRU|nr:flotillin family protein [Selenomonas ruminantium]